MQRYTFLPKNNFLGRKNFFSREGEIEQEENETIFFLLSFSDLPHHHMYHSANGGFYFRFHSKNKSVKHGYAASFSHILDFV